MKVFSVVCADRKLRIMSWTEIKRNTWFYLGLRRLVRDIHFNGKLFLCSESLVVSPPGHKLPACLFELITCPSRLRTRKWLIHCIKHQNPN
jgi:hypothetical protein